MPRMDAWERTARRWVGDLFALAQDKGLTQAQLGRDAGLSTSSVNDWARGVSLPLLARMLKCGHAIEHELVVFKDGRILGVPIPVQVGEPREERALRSIGAVLAQQRKLAKLTPDELAQKLGYTAGWVNRAEAGRFPLTLRQLAEWSGYFGCTAAWWKLTPDQ